MKDGCKDYLSHIESKSFNEIEHYTPSNIMLEKLSIYLEMLESSK